MVFKSYIIDAIQLKGFISEYLTDIMEDSSILKIVEDLSTITKL